MPKANIKAKFIFIRSKKTGTSKWVTKAQWNKIKKTPPKKRPWRRVRAF